MHEPFQCDSQPGRFAQPLDVFPGEVRRKSDIARTALYGATGDSQVLATHSWRKIAEAVAHVPLSLPERRRVHTHNQDVAAGRFGAAHDRFGEAQVRLNIELE